ncbi:MAG: PD40 domain-containing protein [Bryobacterales bacterium]|nr:PD40 domain-containing protein [Bryobacterales bacterium]
MYRTLTLFLLAAAAAIAQQGPDARISIIGASRPKIAVPDLRAGDAAQGFMTTFNTTLFADLQDSAVFEMAAKSFYPVDVPQRPTDFRPPLNGQRSGPWLTDWSNPPVEAQYLTVGFAQSRENRFVLNGWLFNVNQPDVRNAQAFGKLYFAELSNDGAKRVAHEFAADILAHLGFKSMFGSKIAYVRTSGRGNTQTKEIWIMDWDGANKRQLTHHNSISSFPAISVDGTRLAYTSYVKGAPQLMMMSLETGRILPFLNPRATMSSLPDFSRDGRLVFASTAAGSPMQLFSSALDGTGLKRLTNSRSIDVEPKVNPKTGSDIAFVSGRSGPQQIYLMGLDGADASRLSDGTGQASNPAWHPEGQHVAFAWTKGYDPGNFNIFIMDVAKRQYIQLTHGAGRNENPSWAPDGRHIVFSSDRSGTTQIYTMWADGTNVRQLTSEGRNGNPAWGK